MLPYKTLIPLNRQAMSPLPVQIATGLIGCIQRGLLPAGTKLPGSRTLSTLLDVHRQTVVAAYEELDAQGWIYQMPSKGAFISDQIPETQPQPLPLESQRSIPLRTGFEFRIRPILAHPVYLPGPALTINDGAPDNRLAPIDALLMKIRSLGRRNFQRNLFSYGDTNGSLFLRQQLADYIRDSRGIPASAETIFTTRGSIMAIYLLAQILLSPGQKIAMGSPGYWTAEMIFRSRGAMVIPLPVDEEGLNIDALTQKCREEPIRLVYVTPHHHYPTTVTMSPERRIRLLRLAEEYRFAIIEDDYDFEFHYSSSPVLPLASSDSQGMTIYIGSLSKNIAPAFRLGYLVAPPNLIEELGYLRRIIDRQGDNLLEQAVAELFVEGEIQRHLKKAHRQYHQRRDFFCTILQNRLSPWISCRVPHGGMAVWAEFDKAVAIDNLAERCRQKGLELQPDRFYRGKLGEPSHIRLGFASLQPNEIEQSLRILENSLI